MTKIYLFLVFMFAMITLLGVSFIYSVYIEAVVNVSFLGKTLIVYGVIGLVLTLYLIEKEG